MSPRRIRMVVAGLIVLAALIAVLVYCWPRVDPVEGTPSTVVILSSGIGPAGTLDTAGIDRLDVGAQLAKRVNAPRVVTIRVQFTPQGPTSDSVQHAVLLRYGLDDRLLITQSMPPYNTYGEALAIRKALGPGRIIVVTSPPHTRRACAVFEHVGFAVTCYASHDLYRGTLYEMAATIKYWWKGWM